MLIEYKPLPTGFHKRANELPVSNTGGDFYVWIKSTNQVESVCDADYCELEKNEYRFYREPGNDDRDEKPELLVRWPAEDVIMVLFEVENNRWT